MGLGASFDLSGVDVATSKPGSSVPATVWLPAVPTGNELAADIAEPFAVALGEFPLRALLESSDRDDEKAHDSVKLPWI